MNKQFAESGKSIYRDERAPGLIREVEMMCMPPSGNPGRYLFPLSSTDLLETPLLVNQQKLLIVELRRQAILVIPRLSRSYILG